MDHETSFPSQDHLHAAAATIEPYVHRTPVATCGTFDRELGARLFFKCENLQKVGAFKARGATNAVMRLDEKVARHGVITHSSGNHGAALAYAAGRRGISCTVVMPDDAPPIKRNAVQTYGAQIVSCPREERDAVCDRLRQEQGRFLVHPFENFDVVAGQATAAMELLDQVEGLDLVVAPVGGGGLLSGTALAVKGASPEIEVWGAEPEVADDARRSMESGQRQPAVRQPCSWSDGLLTGLGALAFGVLRRWNVEIVTVSERATLEATWSIVERMKLVVEPSAGTALAALRARKADIRGRRIGVILSGGNTDFGWLSDPCLRRC